MTEYTPSTETVRECFLDGAEGNFILADFDRWLAQVERAAAIKATDDAIAVLSKEGWFSPGIEAIASVLRATDGNN